MQSGHQHSSGLESLQVAETMGVYFLLVNNYDVLSPHLKDRNQSTKPPVDLEEM